VDETIYLDTLDSSQLLSTIEFALAFAMAHEFSHHVRLLLNGPFDSRLTIERELEADCYAGVWSLDVDTRGMMEANDISEVLAVMGIIGDPLEVSISNPGAHGSSSQRTASFLSGFYDGFQGCDLELI
jgi:predicted metalloprotease